MPQSKCRTAKMILDRGESQCVSTGICSAINRQVTFKNMRQKDMWVRLHKKTCEICNGKIKEMYRPTTQEEIQERLRKGRWGK